MHSGPFVLFHFTYIATVVATYIPSSSSFGSSDESSSFHSTHINYMYNTDVRFTGGRPAGCDKIHIASWIDVCMEAEGGERHACMMCKRSMIGLNLRRSYKTCMGEIRMMPWIHSYNNLLI